MRVAFMGSGRFAIPSLEALIASEHQVLAVVTQPDKEQGRGRVLLPPPVKAVALSHDIHVLQPRRIRAPEAVAALRDLGAELHVVVAYGQILPKDVLAIPPRGTVNVHGSLLPRYRGAAPVQWAIVEGETETGVTTMLLDEGLDTGPMLLARSTPIGAEETAAELESRLSRLGAELLVETLAGFSQGTIVARPQDPQQASYARILKKDDGRVDWHEPADRLERKVRGFQPWPGMTASLEGRGVRLLKARVEAGGAEPPGTAVAPDPGTVVAVDTEGVAVACGGGSRLRLLQVQPESRRPMPAAAFAAGARLQAGQRFG